MSVCDGTRAVLFTAGRWKAVIPTRLARLHRDGRGGDAVTSADDWMNFVVHARLQQQQQQQCMCEALRLQQLNVALCRSRGAATFSAGRGCVLWQRGETLTATLEAGEMTERRSVGGGGRASERAPQQRPDMTELSGRWRWK